MFTSRKAQTPSLSTPQTILIDIPPSTGVDDAIIPAVVDYILQDLTSTLTRHNASKPNVALVSIDQHPNHFEKLCRRAAIPRSSVIDAFSEWFPLPTQLSDVKDTARLEKIAHVAAAKPTEMKSGSIVFEVCQALASSIHRKSRDRIVIIDSLSSIFRYWPGLNTFLDIRDRLCETKLGNGEESSVCIIYIFRRQGHSAALLSWLKRVSETHVQVRQGERLRRDTRVVAGVFDSARDGRDRVALEVCRRKPSGRVHLEQLAGRVDWQDMKLVDIERGVSFGGRDAKVQSREEERRQQEKMMQQLGLSFRVALSTSEREVRAAAGLPYLHRDENLADSALQLHPTALQIGSEGGHGMDGDEDSEDDSESDEDMFSEDV